MKEKLLIYKYKIIEFIIAQKILSAAISLIVIMTLGIVFISSDQNKTKNTSPFLSVTPKPSYYYQTFTPSSQITGTTETAKTNPQKTYPSAPPASKPANSTIKQSPATSPALSQSPTTRPSTASPTIRPATAQSGSGASGQTQPTSLQNPTLYPTANSNPTSVPSSGPQIVFIGPNGQPETYTPPATPPVEITWARYTNQLEHYAIDYPSNWQIVTTQYRGHDAIFIYSPGANLNDPNVQYISYGWSGYFYPPDASYIGSFTLDSIAGTIYTNGALGTSYIAGIFNYANGFLILNNNVSDATFAYVFAHMLLSLDFNTP